jgi:Txe/YoeB family toxin of toxin-antitoxin system
VVKYRIHYTKQAGSDAKKSTQAGCRGKIEELLEIIAENPYRNPPPYEKLVGDLAGAMSRRINIQHRLVYCVLEDELVVKILRMWSHYE